MKKEILEKVMATGSCETLYYHYERRGNEILRIHQHPKAVLEVDDMQELVRHDEAVAGSEPIRDIAGEVQPLLDEDEGVCTVLLGYLDLLQHEFHIAVGVQLHFVGVVLAGRSGGAHFQSFAELMLTQRVGGRTFRCRLRGSVGELPLQIGGGVAVHPTVSRGGGEFCVFLRWHPEVPPHPSVKQDSAWDRCR